MQSTITRFLIVLQLLSCQVSASGQDDPPLTISRLLQFERERMGRITSVRTVTRWIEVIGEDDPLNFTCTVAQDSLGRVRYEEQLQTPEEGVTLSGWVYDGEIMVDLDDNYDSLKGEGQGKDKLAKILPGPTPDQPRLLPRRDPLKIATLSSLLPESVKNGDDAVIDTAGEFVVVRFPSGNLQQPLANIVTLDPSQEYVVVAAETNDDSGNVLKKIKVEYKLQSSGDYFPASGVIELPLFETRTPIDPVTGKPDETAAKRLPTQKGIIQSFSVQETGINIELPDSLFSVELDSGTFVWDSRFQVHYQVGEEKAVAASLAALAMEARERQAQEDAGIPIRRKSDQNFGLTGIQILILVNIVVAGVVAVLFFIRRQRR